MPYVMVNIELNRYDEVLFICQSCGNRKASIHLDPLALEIYGIKQVVTLCDDCYKSRAYEI